LTNLQIFVPPSTGQAIGTPGTLNAINQLNKAIALDRKFDNAYLELGYTYADMGDMDKAEDQANLLLNRSSALSSYLNDYIYQVYMVCSDSEQYSCLEGK